MDLINEIDIIKVEMINLNQEGNVKREVENGLTKLRKLQLISDDIIELLRYTWVQYYIRSEYVTDASKQL